jgi:hypothetical protein
VSFREDPLGDIYVMNTDPAAMIESASDPTRRSFDRNAANISMIRDARGTVQRSGTPIRHGHPTEKMSCCPRPATEARIFSYAIKREESQTADTKGGTTPRYSEDGTSIVFVSYRDNGPAIYMYSNPASGKKPV